MNIFTLKIIALFTMIIDHLTYLHLDLPYNIYVICRLIGRISFPLYIFIITESLFYTKSKKKFINSLLVLAFISQVPFAFYFGNKLSYLNVLFTLFFGSLIVYNIDNTIKKPINKNITLLTISVFLPIIFRCDYDIIGSFSIPILYYSKIIFSKYKINTNIVSSIYIFFMLLLLYSSVWLPYAYFGAITCVLILSYNKKEGKKFKLLFQISYPLHISIFLLLNIILQN